MRPTLLPGKVVVAIKMPLRVGVIVIAEVQSREVIKRLIRITPEGCWLEGDNKAASTDSRVYGFVPRQDVKAVVITRSTKTA